MSPLRTVVVADVPSSPNVTTCDRVGLAVWLRHPARTVSARINGRPVDLDDPEWSLPTDPPRQAWVDLDVDGQKAGLVVLLHAGWG